MPERFFQELMRFEAGAGWVRLRTLVLLRWLAAAGQALAVAVATIFLGLDLPVALCAVAIFVSVAFNLGVMQFYPRNARLSERAALASMLFDLGQLSVLLFLTGGLTNPFAVLLLAPVTVSASALRTRAAAMVAAGALFAISFLAVWRIPLTFRDGAELSPPGIYVFGVWAALSSALLFMAVYARRVAIENRRMTAALNAAQRALASEQRLTAIGGLAAAAAHELGTPLATIKLVSSELADELGDRPELLDDARLISRQADRCRDILTGLSQGGRSDDHLTRAPITAIVEEAAEPHMDRGKRIIIRIGGRVVGAGGEAPIEVARTPEIIHGLRNVIQNAVDFAETTIWVDVRQGASTLRVIIGDDGQGFPAELIDRLGDPYVSSRPRGGPASRMAGEYRGMGLGLFIAKTLLERSGAAVAFANAERAARRSNRGLPLEARRPSGAVVAVSWPNEALQRTGGAANFSGAVDDAPAA